MVIESKEVQTQFHLSELGGTIISFNEISPLLESFDKSNPHTVICFEGSRGMDLYARKLKAFLEEEKRVKVVVTDHQGLSLNGKGNVGELSEGFCIVQEFHDFNEERMQGLLAEVKKKPNLKWVLLVHTWKNIRMSEILRKWIKEEKIMKFRILAETVPSPKTEPVELKGETIWIKPYLFPNPDNEE